MTLDPDLAAVLAAGAFAAVLAAAGAWRRRREVERFCLECGRRIITGIKSCDCR